MTSANANADALPTVATVSAEALRQRLPSHQRKQARLKGRQPDDAALAEVRALLPAGALRHDLLIENLHALNDHFGALFQRHLVALAAEMKLPMAAVAEVASFYHHFQTLPDEAAAPRLVVRVCDGLSCTMAGAGALMQRLAGVLGEGVQLISAPCVGRCEQAPVAVVGQHGSRHARPGQRGAGGVC